MLSLLVHAILGVVVIAVIIRANRVLFRRTASGPLLSTFEIALYVFGIASIIGGWSFNIAFVVQNTDGWITNPLWGDGSWVTYIQGMFDNPASSSASIDYTIANVLLLPLITIVDGRRRGINKPWLYFVATLFTSFAFGWAFYAATVERQRRLGISAERPQAAAPSPQS